MGDYNIDLDGADANSMVYCTEWYACYAEYPKELSEDGAVALMKKHPILAEFLEYDDCGDGNFEDGCFSGVSLGFTSDKIPFSQFDEDHEFDCRDFDNFKSDSDWDGCEQTIVVDGHTFEVSIGGLGYININYIDHEGGE